MRHEYGPTMEKVDLKLLEDVARQCGQLALRLRDQGDVTMHSKDDTVGLDFATNADDASQELGIRIIQERCPGIPIIAEEQRHEQDLPAEYITFDPIDGTKLFAEGGREWGVTLAAVREGQPVMGVIYFPALDIMLSGERGKGVFLTTKDGTRQLSFLKPVQSVDVQEINLEDGPWFPPEILESIKSQFSVRVMRAGVYDAYEMATGISAAIINLNAGKVWDFAAAALIIQELGGQAVNPWGKPLNWRKLHMDIVCAVGQETLEVLLKHTKNWKGRTL